MSTFEQVLELIQTLTAEEIAQLRERLDDESKINESNKIAPRELGTLASRGKYWMSPDFNEHLGDDFWLGDENDPLSA